MMNERQTEQSPNRWKWVALVVLFLLILMVTCLTSAIWGGVIGYSIGRRDGYRTMDHDWYYEEPLPAYPPVPDTPDMPEMPHFVERPWLGVGFIMGPDGAMISSVVPGSPAAEEGIEVNDVITEVDGVAVTANRPLDELILRYEPGDRIDLTIMRDGRELTIRVRLATLMDGAMPGLPNNFPVEPPLIPDWQG